MELEQNFATCRLLAALINCHWAAHLVVVVAVAFAGFNLAHILCKCPTLRGESKERERWEWRGTTLGCCRCSSLEC